MSEPKEDERVRLRIRGRVQGVFFRATTREKARMLGLRGWVRNRPDGTVEIVAEGPPAAVADLVAFCREGPPAARVDEVQVEREGEPTGELDGFRVRYS